MSTTTLERTAPVTAPAVVQPVQWKRLALQAAALLAVVLLCTVAWRWWTAWRFIESTDDAYVGGEVTVLAPQVPGLIAQVAVSDNQRVKAGDLLLKLDDRDYRAALAKAEAAIAARQATLANLEATRRQQDALIAQAQAVVTATDAETVRTKDDQTRYQRLYTSSTESIQVLQKAQADYQKAVAAGESARANLLSAQRQLAIIDTQKQQARAALDEARADRDLARLNLGYTELRAPVDGMVGNRSARVGAYAGIGTQLITIIPARGLWVDANFKESQIALFQPGQAVTIKADVLAGHDFHGHIASLAPATGSVFSVLPAENATGNFTKIVQRIPVRVALDENADSLGLLRPGLSVTAEVDGRRDR